uniref:uncharacterized protein LOC100178505 isoform X2 n=1 Tax=Ciona intestinalis TaxID=7719 RepID=UPI000EF5137D|nr:uncharacterized protein LOC100178505 isoform X2 [Ciona intestinalis]|eukprot:XP_026695641.1 uncharacterized protein LOC100178505 isoform X2 [Ciona intestinalis]
MEDVNIATSAQDNPTNTTTTDDKQPEIPEDGQNENRDHELEPDTDVVGKNPQACRNEELKEMMASSSHIHVDVDEIAGTVASMVTQTSINGENAGLGATSEKIELNDDLIQRIKQEVLDAVREEIAAIRRDVNTDFPSTTRGAVAKQPTIVRNPKNIKEEIRKLKKEMKEMKIKKKSVERSKKQSASSITRKFAASFICENLCDGSCVSIGESFVKYWVLKNEGARVWDGKVTLELIQESPSLGSSVDPAIDFNNLLKWGPQITSVQVPIVQPSGTAVLAVTHVAPAYPCAYTSSWCLQRNGRIFGPRVWCTVQVVERKKEGGLKTTCPSVTEDEPESETSYIGDDSKWIRRQTSENKPPVHADDFNNIITFQMEDIGDSDIMRSPQEKYSYAVPSNRPLVQKDQPAEATDVQDNIPSNQTNQPLTEDTKTVQPGGLPSESLKSIEEKKEDGSERSEIKEENKQEECENEVSDFESIGLVEQHEDPQEEQEDGEEEEDGEDEDSNDVSSSDEEGSEHMSDFEVIPLPECFDTSRPLSAPTSMENNEPVNQENTPINQDEVVNHPDEVVIDNDDAAKQEDTSANQDDEPVTQVDEPVTHDDEPVTHDDEPITHDDEPVTHDDEPVNQIDEPVNQENDHATSQNETSQPINPTPVHSLPQSIIDLDKPCPVVDYTQGYITPSQRTAPVDEPWTQQPIPLPRGVLDADKPWVAVVAPHKVPAHRTSQMLPSETTSKPWDAESILSSGTEVPNPHNTDEADSLNGDDSPQIYYPPHDGIDEDEFILAPQSAPTPPTLAPVAPTPLIFNPSPMDQLFEMGFSDYDLNVEVLNRCGGDVAKAVQMLLTPGTSRTRHPRNGGYTEV